MVKTEDIHGMYTAQALAAGAAPLCRYFITYAAYEPLEEYLPCCCESH
jgi:hypothetical protein